MKEQEALSVETTEVLAQTPVVEPQQEVVNEAESVEPATEAPQEAPATAEVLIEQETSAEEAATAEETEEKVAVSYIGKSKEELLEHLKEIAENVEEMANRTEMDAIKQAYFLLQRDELIKAKEAHDAAMAELPEEERSLFITPEIPEDILFKALLQSIKEKKAALIVAAEKRREEALQLKEAILEEFRQLSETSEEQIDTLFNSFKSLQQRWREITDVPASKMNDLWKQYQYLCEKIYDRIKINIELRDYDFKKNLELKAKLCEAAEALTEVNDPISAFYQLQKLHEEWREIGPVAKEQREEMWNRFKAASTLVNKRHHEYFEGIKAIETANLTAKEELCKRVEEIDFDSLKTFKEWEEKAQEIINLQQEWRTIGFTAKKDNAPIFARFRAACDQFFTRKSSFYKELRSSLDGNLKKKQTLCTQAEQLRDSTEWAATTDKIIALQKEWRTIGAVPRKESDTVWKRFQTACDFFFEQKKAATKDARSEERDNLKAKQAVLAEAQAFTLTGNNNADLETVRDLSSRFNAIGHVPFKEKDKLYKAFREVMDKLFGDLKVNRSEGRINNYRKNVANMANAGKGRMMSEKDRLRRLHDKIKSDIATYENNLGFLSVSSKGGNSLLKEMEKQMDRLREELNEIRRKMQALDDAM